MLCYPVAAALCALLVMGTADFAVAACTLETGPRATVVRVIDSETIQLDDGREVRLIGALGPKPDLANASQDWPAEREARDALTALVAGRTVELKFQGRRSDRYGRALAHLFVGETWVQRSLIGAGHSRAYGLPGNAGCLAELLAAETDARKAHRGLWARDAYAVRDAADARQLLGFAGRFVVVEGRVAGVGRTGKTLYLNFGADWRRDFTAAISRTVIEESGSRPEALEALEGRRIRVRGWIERRNGPSISLNSPDEIEVIEDGAAKTTAPR
jgi:endonuclease YncB( thermonuclease family)